jgi:hypothetical protein
MFYGVGMHSICGGTISHMSAGTAFEAFPDKISNICQNCEFGMFINFRSQDISICILPRRPGGKREILTGWIWTKGNRENGGK